MNDDGFVPPSALTACREARRQGHILYICSGRPRAYISDEILAIGFDGLAGSGGAYIETGNTSGEFPYHGKVIFNASISVETVKQLSDYFNSRQCCFSLEKNDIIFSNYYFLSYWKSLLDYFTKLKTAEKLVYQINNLLRNPLPEDPRSYDASVYENVNKIMFTGKNGTFTAVKQDFDGECEIFRGSMLNCDDECGEIGPRGIHKGTALKTVAEYHGIALADTIAFGDSDNDRKMLESAGIGIAMGNARDALKEIADDTTSSLEDDGIFKGFIKHGLIQHTD